MHEQIGTIDHEGTALAYAHLAGEGPTVVFLPGFASDMQGSKALHLRTVCAARGQAMLRLDYSGHGTSGGEFTEGTISRWAGDARAVIDRVVPHGKLILVGSSMGGWIMLLLVRALASRIAGLLGIAAAPDFTEDLIRPSLTTEAIAHLASNRDIALPNPYGPPTVLTPGLFEDGANHLVLRSTIDFTGPTRLIHGQCDLEVPWQTSLRVAERIASTDTRVLLIKDGEHRLSRPSDLAAIEDVLLSLTRP